MDLLTNLNGVLGQLQRNFAVDGVTLAGLMIVVYAIMIMFHNDTSPAARSQRWENLQKVLICAGIIVGATSLVQVVISFFQTVGLKK